MTRRHRTATRIAMVGLLLGWGLAVGTGCGDDETEAADTGGARPDAGVDGDTSEADVEGDVPSDVGAEVSVDAEGDTDTADSLDAAEDSAGDVADTAADADVEVEPEVGPEPEPDGPPQVLLTINEMPAEMNGSQPYYDDGNGPTEFSWLLPTYGFTLDVWVDRSAVYLDADTLEVRCDQAMGTGESAVAADSDIGERFAWEGEQVRLLLPPELAFPVGRVSCEGRVANLDGEMSEWSTVDFDTAEQTEATHPFDPPDVWVVTFSRDRYDVWSDWDTGQYRVYSEELASDGGDGEADFIEDLRVFGLQGDESGAGASTVEGRGQVGVNAIMADWIISETMARAREAYEVDPETGVPVDEDSVQIFIYREGDPDAPDPAAWDGESFSIHGVGGDTPPEDPLNFGRATAVDINNPTAQDDSILGYGSFTTNVARQVAEHPGGRYLLRDWLPGYGVPVGESDLDAIILSDDFDRDEASPGEVARLKSLETVVELFTKALGSLVAHEMGHSVGLVACGPPPRGLFSGVYDERWMASDPGCGHIDTPGLNIMQTGGSLLAEPQSILGEVAFNAISMAYLRGRVIVDR